MIGYSNTDFLDFEVTLVDTCGTAVLTLDPTILSQTSMTYTIGEPAYEEQLDDSKVIASPVPLTECAVNYFFENQNESAIDSSVFVHTPTPGS